MYSIKITEEVYDTRKMALMLREIARLIDEGYSSGFDPTWSIDHEDYRKHCEKCGGIRDVEALICSKCTAS